MRLLLEGNAGRLALRWRWAIGLTLLVGGALIFLLGRPWYGTSDRQTRAGVTHRTQWRASIPLTTTVWLPKDRLEEGALLHWKVLFENTSETQSMGIEVIDFLSPGFTLFGNCWEDQLPSCRDGYRRDSTSFQLSPGEVSVLEGWLQAGRDSGSFRHSILLRANTSRSSGFATVPFPAVEVASGLVSGARRVARRLHVIGRDLAIPIAVVLFALLYQYWDRRREQERSDAADRRTEINQTWNKLIDKTLDDAQKYYLPLITDARTVWEEFERTTEKEAADSSVKPTRCLYHLVYFLRRVRTVRERIGGFHLKQELAEEILVTCLLVFLRMTKERLDPLREGDLGYAELKVKINGQQQDFREALGNDATLQRVRDRFAAWISVEQDFSDTLEVLRLFVTVLVFEVNRPFYQYWYEVAPDERFPHDALVAHRAALASMSRSDPKIAPHITELDAVLGNYLALNGPRKTSTEKPGDSSDAGSGPGTTGTTSSEGTTAAGPGTR